ncbi:MAG: hypothetical protein IKR94_08970, partial [Bacteroidales bacterium]|nr:hypothetical protein [Bacteroidales bacterium]
MEEININLDSFKNHSNLIKASVEFFEQLNIYVTPVTEQIPVPVLELFESQSIQNQRLTDFFKVDGKSLNTFFVGTLNDRSLYQLDEHGQATLADEMQNAKDSSSQIAPIYTSMMIFAVEVDPFKSLSKNEISIVCRAFNRVFANGNPVVVLFRHGDKLTFSLCERTPYRRTTFQGQKAGKVSMLRNISIHKPHSGHIRILWKIQKYKERSKNKVISFNDLYLYWLNEVFAVNVLTDDFYREISEWYEWVTDCESKTPKPIIQFPDMLGDTSIDEKQRIVKEHALRLITRLMFVWFCKQKNLVADELFDIEELKKSIVDFDFGIEDKTKLNIREFDPDDEKSSVYYNAIIQNLFFATINTKINEREWAEQTQVDGKQFYSFNQRFKTVWRDNNQQSFFIGGYKKEQAQKIASYFNQSPFLNGGLFAPLDRREPIEDAKTGLYKLKYNGEIEYSKVIYHDGFSRDNKANHRAFVPNCAIIGKSGSNIGLISIFKKYYFTVEENTPIEVDVALDPELLGNVFENLIGLYNPETHDIVQKAKQEAQRNRRKATGSFYTPKEIVQYMTQSSVVQYLVKETGYDFQDIETLVKDDNLPDSFLDKFGELKTDVAETISDAIIKCKILDPACGSGAFPMGCLQILNSILARIDNDNKVWQ